MTNAPDAFVYNATLDRIIDGDTFDCVLDLGFDVKLHKQRVRLSGIDTPESRINTKRYPDRAKEKIMGKPISQNFAQNSTLNDLLNETAATPATQELTDWSTMKFKSEMAEAFGMPAKTTVAPTTGINGESINMQKEGVAATVNAMTKDYSALMKAIDKKKGK